MKAKPSKVTLTFPDEPNRSREFDNWTEALKFLKKREARLKGLIVEEEENVSVPDLQ